MIHIKKITTHKNPPETFQIIEEYKILYSYVYILDRNGKNILLIGVVIKYQKTNMVYILEY